ncbi:MAG TPA: T9SS type A sorting domain-containing protein [Bacteroidota bacterium]|nr:T9SS type A sorting domain-containing protein [Bacteroidota bacterium]
MRTFVALFCCALFATTAIQAQSPTPNIATSAVCTHSGGGSGTYAPTAYNDAVIPPFPLPANCNSSVSATLPWGWTSTGTGQNNTSYWIQFEWTTPQTFGEITFYYGTMCYRYMSGATIQVWNGSTWVDAHTFVFPAPAYDQPVRSVQFTPVTTTRMRITNMLITANGTMQASNPAFREIEVRNVCTDPQTAVDFDAPAFITLPNTIPINFTMNRAIGSFDAKITFNFYTPTGILVHSEQTTVPFTPPTVNGQYVVQSTNLTPGFYKLEVVFNVFDICNKLTDVKVEKVVMVLSPGQTLCEVWPGDTDNNGLVNYNDRSALNDYIHDANLSTVWLNGPARYRADAAGNPFTYYTWELQPGVPWQTPQGCYMDADGNGVVNNFDYIAIKLNWLKNKVPVAPKSSSRFDAGSFDLSQNFPNPFNPSTMLKYSVPERSQVELVVVDMLGRTVATLVAGTVEAGVYNVVFDASALTSGQYIARVRMTGLESGLVFSKTVKMTLNK